MITLYSTHCPKCKVLEKKLATLDKEYKIVDNVDEVVAFGEKVGMTSAPILDVDGQVMDFVKANRWLNSPEAETSCASCEV